MLVLLSCYFSCSFVALLLEQLLSSVKLCESFLLLSLRTTFLGLPQFQRELLIYYKLRSNCQCCSLFYCVCCRLRSSSFYCFLLFCSPLILVFLSFLLGTQRFELRTLHIETRGSFSFFVSLFLRFSTVGLGRGVLLENGHGLLSLSFSFFPPTWRLCVLSDSASPIALSNALSL
jgi:hypothetical protein